MTDSTHNQILWGFLRYARNNPHSHLNSVHWDEIDKMAEMFATTNYTDSNDTLTTTDPGAYGTAQDVPAKGAVIGSADGTGVSCAAPTSAVYDQAQYPQDHHGIAE